MADTMQECGTAAPACQCGANDPGTTGEGACATRPELARAWAVHLLTASGAVFGLLAMTTAARGDYVASLCWMAVTIFIDGIDGALARRFRVKAVIPSLDGALLDNVVDYFTWSVVPAFFLCMSPLAGEWCRYPVAAAILIASGYQFARSDAKTEDHSFSGFPSYWNIVVFYLFMLKYPVWFNVAVLLLCAAASFAPLRCLYPSRTPHWRAFNVAFGALWALCLAVALIRHPIGHMPYISLSWIYVVYYAGFSAWLTLRAGRQYGKGAAA
jgi:phosphatidylcholine synthase